MNSQSHLTHLGLMFKRPSASRKLCTGALLNRPPSSRFRGICIYYMLCGSSTSVSNGTLHSVLHFVELTCLMCPYALWLHKRENTRAIASTNTVFVAAQERFTVSLEFGPLNSDPQRWKGQLLVQQDSRSYHLVSDSTPQTKN